MIRSSRVAALVAAVASVLLLIGMIVVGFGVLRDGHAETGPRETGAGDGGASTLPAACGQNVQCAVTPGGYLVMMLAHSHGSTAARKPVILLELGGPGADVSSMVGILPAWTERFRVLLVPEPWTYRTSEFCSSYSCAGSTLDAKSRVATARWAEHHWGRIRSVYAFSYGAVMALPLAQDAHFSAARFWFVSPAPLPRTPIEAVFGGRLRSTIASMARVQCGVKATCHTRVKLRLRAIANGDLGVSSADGSLGLLSIGADAAGNRAAIAIIARGGIHAPLTARARQLLAEGAFTYRISGSDPAIQRRRDFYDQAMCRTYTGWSGKQAPFVTPIDCGGTSSEPVASVERPTVARNVTLVVNENDPVVPVALQRRWRAVVGARRVAEYRRDDHDLSDRDELHP